MPGFEAWLHDQTGLPRRVVVCQWVQEEPMDEVNSKASKNGVNYGPSNGRGSPSFGRKLGSTAWMRTGKPDDPDVGMLCPDGPEGRLIPSSTRSSR
jgi:hypothetical protein